MCEKAETMCKGVCVGASLMTFVLVVKHSWHKLCDAALHTKSR